MSEKLVDVEAKMCLSSVDEKQMFDWNEEK